MQNTHIALVTGANKGIGFEIADEVARTAVRLATLPGDGPTGCFFNKEGRMSW